MAGSIPGLGRFDGEPLRVLREARWRQQIGNRSRSLDLLGKDPENPAVTVWASGAAPQVLSSTPDAGTEPRQRRGGVRLRYPRGLQDAMSHARGVAE